MPLTGDWVHMKDVEVFLSNELGLGPDELNLVLGSVYAVTITARKPMSTHR